MTEKPSLEKWHRFNYGTGNCCQKISAKWPIVKKKASAKTAIPVTASLYTQGAQLVLALNISDIDFKVIYFQTDFSKVA